MVRNYWIELTDLFFEENVEKCFEMFNQKTKEEKKTLLIETLKQYDLRYIVDETDQDAYFFGSSCDDVISQIYMKEDFYGEVFSSYVMDNEFVGFDNLDSSFFRSIPFTQKEAFLKILKIKPSTQLLINNLHFDFTETDISFIKKIIEDNRNGFQIYDIEDKKKLVNKIGLYPHFLIMPFNHNTTENEFEYFLNNLHLINEKEKMRVVMNNFLKYGIRDMLKRDISDFRLDLFLRFHNVCPDIFQKVKVLFENGEVPYNNISIAHRETTEKMIELINNAINIRDF